MSKKKAQFDIQKRRDGRYMVVKPRGGNINGIEKTKILLEAGLIKTGLPKEAPAEEADEAAAE